MNKKTKTLIWVIVAVVAVLLVGVVISDVLGSAQSISIPEFIGKLAKGEINELYVDAYNWTGYTVVDGRVTAAYTVTMPSIYNAHCWL